VEVLSQSPRTLYRKLSAKSVVAVSIRNVGVNCPRRDFCANGPIESSPVLSKLTKCGQSSNSSRSWGVKMTPELKEAIVPMPFNGFTQQDYAKKMINEYKAAGVAPQNVFHNPLISTTSSIGITNRHSETRLCFWMMPTLR
jgi:hypothetical protein